MRKKVVIVGKGEAGKSTLIRTLSPNAVNVEHRGRTVALDFGVVTVRGREFHLFGTPGQARFQAVRDVVGFKADAALVVFDSSRPIDPDDEQILDEIRISGVPFFGVLNLKEGLPQTTDVPDVENVIRTIPGFSGLYSGSVMDQTFAENLIHSLP